MGSFHLVCAQYCGTHHSQMMGTSRFALYALAGGVFVAALFVMVFTDYPLRQAGERANCRPNEAPVISGR